MCNIHGVHVLNRFKYLFEEMFSVFFGVTAKLCDLLKYFNTIYKVHDIMCFSRKVICKQFMWFYNIFVIELLSNIKFFLKCYLFFWIISSWNLNCIGTHFLFIINFKTFVYNSMHSFAKFFISCVKLFECSLILFIIICLKLFGDFCYISHSFILITA